MASKKSRPLDDPPAASSSEEEEVETEDEEEEEEEEQEEEIVPKSQSKLQSKPQSKQTDAQEEEEEEESEEEEEEREDEQSNDEEDDEEEQSPDEKRKKKTANQKNPAQISGNVKKNPPPETSSESDSPKSPRASDFTIKRVTDDSKPQPETPVSKPSAAKRRAENGKSASKPSKKAKTTEPAGAGEDDDEDAAGGATASEKKFAINRLWSEEDEIRILKGLLDFHSKFGKDVSTHNQEFHDFVKSSLHVDVTKNQLIDKVRRLKRKFKTNMERSTNGEDPSFSKAHELKSFQLCKKIWGNPSEKNGGVDDNANNTHEKPRSSRKVGAEKSKPVASIEANAAITPKAAIKERELVKGKTEKVEGKEGENDDLGKLYPSLMSACQPDQMSNLPIPEFLKSNLSLLGSSELKDLDSKWKKQNAAEMEVYLGRIDLLREEARMVLNAMKSNRN